MKTLISTTHHLKEVGFPQLRNSYEWLYETKDNWDSFEADSLEEAKIIRRN